jgi:FolB domain-containing protein
MKVVLKNSRGEFLSTTFMERTGMDQVIIKDLLARGVIGITDRERERAQDILINATVFTDVRRAAESDAIEDCVDYSRLAKKLLAHAESAGRRTVEALVSDLARLCLEETGVSGVRIRVEKPGAVRFARSVGVEIERFREA